MNTFQTTACVIAFAVPQAAAAQTVPLESRSAATAAPQLSYESAFDDYKAYEDVPPADWRQVNDTVRAAAASRQPGHAAQGAKASEGSVPGKDAAPSPAPARGGDER